MTQNPITLKEISSENWYQVAKLSRTLTDAQRNQVADNAYSMLEAIYEYPGHTFARAAYDGDEIVGFIMYGHEEKQWWIIRLMVAQPHQGKGYGRGIMQRVIDIVKANPETESINISFVPGNDVAQKLYASLGFADTGTIEDGELVYKLRFER